MILYTICVVLYCCVTLGTFIVIDSAYMISSSVEEDPLELFVAGSTAVFWPIVIPVAALYFSVAEKSLEAFLGFVFWGVVSSFVCGNIYLGLFT